VILFFCKKFSTKFFHLIFFILDAKKNLPEAFLFVMDAKKKNLSDFFFVLNVKIFSSFFFRFVS